MYVYHTMKRMTSKHNTLLISERDNTSTWDIEFKFTAEFADNLVCRKTNIEAD